MTKPIAQNFFDEFGIPNVFGVVDGIHIHFSQKQAIDGEVYWTRKCRYHNITQNAQVVYEFDKIVI
jgi:hypothetical protein